MASLNPEENLMPCKLRKLPYACYEIYFTVIQNFSQAEVVTRTNENPPKNTKLAAVFSVLFLSFLPFIFIYARKKRKQPPIDSGHIEIGQFQFDPKKMQLILKKQSIELSSKESDLLFLLVTNENQTLKREFILKEIWGDEGDYIGRTLDVFISKLRKKLAADAQLKIINIRGVGYRFVKN
jgi:DNA-binding response OmpR family regulator